MRARIYRPARTAMQSGRAKTKRWLLEFEQAAPREIEPLMGWTSSRDTRQQLRLWFDTREDAVAYAQKNGIDAQLISDTRRRRQVVSYSDNFRFDRRGQWTH
ncbi:MAG: ETC complex I subunit [Rhodobiaceae bacterium]|nr:ETC complex I subunit [Rhodobiaceae bacterium]MCC0015074.1 ETC complex I subunit [Rhodobiaceae bacterium]MCC0052917.1 ETC complex I subunit [Rhodobiaceae bacterium]